MPTHVEAIASLNAGMEAMDSRITTMEEHCAADMQQVMAAIERLTKMAEDNQSAVHDPTDHHPGKQPMFTNLAPPLHHSTTPRHPTISCSRPPQHPQ
ncbi:unnamed protein product [Rhodiola kirilowii]